MRYRAETYRRTKLVIWSCHSIWFWYIIIVSISGSSSRRSSITAVWAVRLMMVLCICVVDVAGVSWQWAGSHCPLLVWIVIVVIWAMIIINWLFLYVYSVIIVSSAVHIPNFINLYVWEPFNEVSWQMGICMFLWKCRVRVGGMYVHISPAVLLLHTNCCGCVVVVREPVCFWELYLLVSPYCILK